MASSNRSIRTRLTEWLARHRRRTVQGLLHCLAFMFLAIGGYLLTYQLYFTQLRLEDMSKSHDGGTREDFRYDFEVYFHGTRLSAADPRTTIDYGSIRLLDAARSKTLEVYVRLEGTADAAISTSPGALLIRTYHRASKKRADTQRIELTADTLQKFEIPWITDDHGLNRLRIDYEPAEPDSEVDVLVSTEVNGVTFWGWIVFCFLSALLIVLICLWRNEWRNAAFAIAATIVIAVMSFLHSGALISTEYFQHADSAIIRAARFAHEGGVSSRMYRSAGYLSLPMLTIAVEGHDATHDRRYFWDTFPTTRYMMFVWLGLSVVILMRAIERHYRLALAVTMGLLLALFYPFIIDCYNVAEDSYAIPLMMGVVAAFIRILHGRRKTFRWVIALAGLLFLMLSVKVTPIVLLVAITAALAFGRLTGSNLRWSRLALIAVVLFGAAAGGRAVGKVKDRWVTDTEPYASGVLWEMLWAANGRFDSHTAHWFTKSGPLRSQRVAERTGLPKRPSHLRHSKRATDDVYRPDVKKAMANRPGFFYSNAWLRLQDYALTFMRYTEGGNGWWYPWLERDGTLGSAVINGEEVRLMNAERRAIRHGRMWKIAPLVAWTKNIQTMSQQMDVFILMCAVTGAFLYRRREIAVFILLCVLAKYGLSGGVHAMNRYVNFLNVAILLGLALFITSLWSALRLGAEPWCTHIRTRSHPATTDD